MVSISSSVRGINRTFYIPLYEKEMVKMFTKLKKAIITKWIYKRSIKEFEAKGAVLNDIRISIEEIDGEVYGKLEMFRVLRCYGNNKPTPILQVNRPRKIEVYSKGWKLYFNEEMGELPEIPEMI